MHNIYPWQNKTWQYLLECLTKGRLAHAFLLLGPEATGKLTFAKTFAELLLCKTKNQNHACGICENCLLLDANTHPDLTIIQPEGESKVIKIEQIRLLSNILNQTSQQGGYKIAIIKEASSMNLAAANALLKTLEEPKGQTVFILVTEKIHALPETVRSRCQIISMPLPSFSLARDWLKREIPSHDIKAIDNLLMLADGAPLKALALQNTDLNARENLLKDLVGLHKQMVDPITLGERYLNLELKTFCIYLMNWLTILVKLKISENLNYQLMIENTEALSLRTLITKINLKHLFIFFDKLMNLHKFVLAGVNLNKQLTFEDLLFDWQAL